MTEEKKGFSVFKLLVILCILAGIGGTILLCIQKDSKTDWLTYLKNSTYPVIQKITGTVHQKKHLTPAQERRVIVSDAAGEQQKIEISEKLFDATEAVAETQELPAVIINETEEVPTTEMDATPDTAPQDTEEALDSIVQIIEAEPVEEIESVPEEVQPMIEEGTDPVINLTDAPPPEIRKQVQLKSEPHQKVATSYTWKDFQAGLPCQASDILDENNKEISNLIYSYCKLPEMDAWQKWQDSFREGKRTYLIQQRLKEKTKYIKYLKVLPHLLFDVYKTNATGSSLAEQLDQIETLIAKRQTHKAVEMLKNITDDQARLALNPALTEGTHLIEIQNFLNARASEGGEND